MFCCFEIIKLYDIWNCCYDTWIFLENVYSNLKSLFEFVKIFIFDNFDLQHTISNVRFWTIQHYFTIVLVIVLNLIWINQLHWYQCKNNSIFYLTTKFRSIKWTLYYRNDYYFFRLFVFYSSHIFHLLINFRSFVDICIDVDFSFAFDNDSHWYNCDRCEINIFLIVLHRLTVHLTWWKRHNRVIKRKRLIRKNLHYFVNRQINCLSFDKFK